MNPPNAASPDCRDADAATYTARPASPGRASRAAGGKPGADPAGRRGTRTVVPLEHLRPAVPGWPAVPADLTADQEQAGDRIDALDLDPVAFLLARPDPGLILMDPAEAGEIVTAYRNWLKLCAWYPGEPLVPTLPVGDAWHAHLVDTARYARDCQAAFGTYAHCFPYYAHQHSQLPWHNAYKRTLGLYGAHFGAGMPGARAGDDEALHPDGPCCTGAAASVLVLAGAAGAGACSSLLLDLQRPGLPRPLAPAVPIRPAARACAGLTAAGAGDVT